MKIYFDGILIDNDMYTSITDKWQLFDDTFYLGSTASNEFKITIMKEAVASTPNIIEIKNEEDEVLSVLKVTNIEENEFEYIYTLNDAMLDLSFNYDASEIFVDESATLLNIVKDICLKANLSLANEDFVGSDKVISWYDNTITAREYIGYVAELSGGYATIGSDGRLYIKQFDKNSKKTIDIDECSDYKIGQYHKITRVVYDIGTQKWEFGDETGDTYYVNTDNVFITDESDIENIYNNINGFEFYSFSVTDYPVDFNIKPGEVVTFDIYGDLYKTIIQYDLTYFGTWLGGNALEVNTEKQEETKVVGVNKKVKSLNTRLNRNEAELQIIANEADTINENLKNVYTKEQINELIINAESGLTNTYQLTGGNNIWRNSAPYFMESEDTAEYWDGKVKQTIETKSTSGYALLLQNGVISQTQENLKSTTYTNRLYFKEVIPLSTLKIAYNNRSFVITGNTIINNGVEVVLENGVYEDPDITINMNDGFIKSTGNVSYGTITITLECDTDNGYEIYDLMLNYGTEPLVWTQNPNESKSDTVNISKGITVSSNATNTNAMMNSNGFSVENKTTNEKVLTATDTGIETKDIYVRGVSNLSGLLIQQMSNGEIWITGGGN